MRDEVLQQQQTEFIWYLLTSHALDLITQSTYRLINLPGMV